MNSQDFNALVVRTSKTTFDLLTIKGGEYADSEDRLANFKRGAALTGVTQAQCAFVYMSKHYDAVATFVRDQANGTQRQRSEPIEGRLDDLINYCLLLKAIIQEGASQCSVTETAHQTQESQLSVRPGGTTKSGLENLS